MNIGIIGTGEVGSALGRLWAAKGHAVMFGSRDPQSPKVRALLGAIGAARAGSAREAAQFGTVVVLATPFHATEAAIRTAGNLSGKIVVDATNPLNADTPPSGLTVGLTTSAAEHIAAWAPGARVVKGFNTLGARLFVDPVFDGQAASMFLCSDDADAKRVVAGLAAELGFDVVDAGPLINARWLEPLAMLWIKLSLAQGMRPIAFKLLRRSGQ
jgi:8-hydroxy-5-deazaflavin:NADPH oxidoreductase